MKIAYVISTLHGGGAERMLVNLVNALPSTMEIHVIVLKTTGRMAEHLRHPQARIHTLKIRSHADLAGWIRFARLLASIRPDIVHSHMTLSNLATRVTRPFSRIPILVNHEHGLGVWKGRALCFLDGVTQGLTDRVITVSRASRQIRISRERINPRRILTMYNAIDWTYWSRVTPAGQRSGLSLGVAASLTRVKRIDLALRVLAGLRAARPDARLLVAGEGPELAHLKTLARELGIAPYVEFLGFVQDMAGFYAKVDAVLLTSLREDCPMALLEAVAAGRFVVGPATGGVPEVLQPPVEGAVIDNSDDLSDVIQRLRDLPAGFDSRVNRDYARRFDIAEYARGIVSLYEELAERRPATAIETRCVYRMDES